MTKFGMCVMAFLLINEDDAVGLLLYGNFDEFHVFQVPSSKFQVPSIKMFFFDIINSLKFNIHSFSRILWLFLNAEIYYNRCAPTTIVHHWTFRAQTYIFHSISTWSLVINIKNYFCMRLARLDRVYKDFLSGL